MLKPSKLGYAELAVKDMEGMAHYYSEIMGFTLMEEDEKGRKYFSSGLDHHNIVLTPVNDSNLLSMGFQIDKGVSLIEVQKELNKLGISSKFKSDAQPGVPEQLELKDPDGFTVNLFSEIDTPAPRFKEKGIIPNKLGHLGLASMKPLLTTAFYRDVLNLYHTDRIDEIANFLTCNTDHHVINVSNLGKRIGQRNLYHIAFELRDASHQYQALDILAKNDIKVLWGPIRHTAGHNVAAYHHDPDGNLVETFIEMDQLIPGLGYFDPRPWHEDFPMLPGSWDTNSQWGTKFEGTLLDYASKKYEKVSNS